MTSGNSMIWWVWQLTTPFCSSLWARAVQRRSCHVVLWFRPRYATCSVLRQLLSWSKFSYNERAVICHRIPRWCVSGPFIGFGRDVMEPFPSSALLRLSHLTRTVTYVECIFLSSLCHLSYPLFHLSSSSSSSMQPVIKRRVCPC